MRRFGDRSAPVFSSFEPLIFDEMEDNVDMHCFDPVVLDSPTPNDTREIDDMFFTSSSTTTGPDSQISPNKLNKGGPSSSGAFVGSRSSPSDTRSDSPGDSSYSSSADSSRGHIQNGSLNSNNPATFSRGGAVTGQYIPDGWPNADDFSIGGFAMDTDIESSNKLMDSSFDFDSAASSPSPLKVETATEHSAKLHSPKQSFHAPSRSLDGARDAKSPSPVS